MVFATKKECAPLIAQLAEESLRTVKETGCEEFSRVYWCKERILTIERFGDDLLVRVDAVLHGCHTPEVERMVQNAAMRESGYYQLSTREMSGFVLAQVMIYTNPESSDLSHELEALYGKLEEVLSAS